jgi:hypothetical protein
VGGIDGFRAVLRQPIKAPPAVQSRGRPHLRAAQTPAK